MPGSRSLLGALASFPLGLAALVAALAGCDSAPGPQPLDARPPVVSDFAFSPDSVFFDDAVTSGDSAAIDLALSVRADDPDGGQIDRVEFAVRWQFAPSNEPSVTGVLEPGDDGRYAGSVGLALPRNRRGLYSIVVYAVDSDGLLSNQVRGLFELAGFGLGPPVIDAVEAPAEFRPPGTLQLIAVVSDPDGLSDVARAEVQFPAPFSGVFALADDGGAGSGDATAGDGRYTVTFDIPAADPGPVTVTFRAFDRDGMASADVPFTITIL